MCHKRSEISSNNAVPRGALVLVHLEKFRMLEHNRTSGTYSLLNIFSNFLGTGR